MGVLREGDRILVELVEACLLLVLEVVEAGLLFLDLRIVLVPYLSHGLFEGRGLRWWVFGGGKVFGRGGEDGGRGGLVGID